VNEVALIPTQKDALAIFALVTQSIMKDFDSLYPSNLLAVTKKTNFEKDFSFGLHTLALI
jgi:hypothetical protein